MAEVPYNPVPDVAPQTSVPDDYQHISPRPEQFGGLIARGLEQGGQGVEQTSTNLFATAKFYGEARADNATNVLQGGAHKVLYGDPAAPRLDEAGNPVLGPDGKPLPDTGFFGLTGHDAMAAWPATKQKIDDLQKQARSSLTSPEQQLQFDQFTRRFRDYTDAEIGKHADSQTKTWISGVNTSGANLATTHIAIHANDPDPAARNAGFADLIKFKVQEAQARFGNDPTAMSAAAASARQEGVKAWIEGVAATGDFAKADRIADKNRDDLGTFYEPIKNQLRDKATDQTAADKATTIINRARAGNFSQPVNSAISNAAARYGIDPATLTRAAQVESGGNPNARTGSYQGLFQLSTPEFAKYGPQGGNIWNPVDNAEAAAAKMKAEGDQFARNFGRQPSGFDSYMIHQQGLAGYSSHLANPNAPAWTNMLATGEGRQKGAGWAKQAIWGNIPDQYKASFGSVNNVTSRDFLAMWATKFGGGAKPQFEIAPGVDARTGATAPLFAGGVGAAPAPAPQRPMVLDEPPSSVPAPTSWQLTPDQSPWGNEGRGAFAAATFEPPNMAAAIKPNVIQQILDDPEAQADPRMRDAMLRSAERTLNAQQVAANESHRQRDEIAEGAADEHTQRIWSMRGQPHQTWTQLFNEILADPRLAGHAEVRNRLLERVTNDFGMNELISNGPGFFEARQAMLLPPGTPGRINTRLDIYRLEPGEVTSAGQRKLLQEFGDIRKDTKEASSLRTIESIERGIKVHMVRDRLYEGAPVDRKGEELFNEVFVPQFEAAYTSAVEKGDDPRKVLSREFAQKLADQIYPPGDRNADRLSAMGESAGPGGSQNVALPPPPQGIDPARWQNVMALAPADARGTPITQAWAESLARLRADPSPKMMAYFDRAFGPAGLTAMDVLARLDPAAAIAAKAVADGGAPGPAAATPVAWPGETPSGGGTPGPTPATWPGETTAAPAAPAAPATASSPAPAPHVFTPRGIPSAAMRDAIEQRHAQTEAAREASEAQTRETAATLRGGHRQPTEEERAANMRTARERERQREEADLDRQEAELRKEEPPHAKPHHPGTEQQLARIAKRRSELQAEREKAV